MSLPLFSINGFSSKPLINDVMSIINNDRVKQMAQNPGPVGRNQSQKVSTHEGSQLGTPTKAGESVKRIPHL